MKLTTFLALSVLMAIAFAVAAIGRSEYMSATGFGFCAWFAFIACLAASDQKETP